MIIKITLKYLFNEKIGKKQSLNEHRFREGMKK